MFGGKTFESLKKHPYVINSASGLSSDAAGKYQFLSTTYKKHNMPDFSEKSQDLAAIKEIQQAGVDINGPLTPEVIDRLADIWASFPGLATGTSKYGQGGKSFDQLMDYYRTALEQEMKRNEKYQDPANMIFREGRQ